MSLNLLRGSIYATVDELLTTINNKFDYIVTELKIDSFIDELTKTFDPVINQQIDFLNFDENTNIYDVYYQLLIDKSNGKLQYFTLGNFEYPNSFSIHINNTNFWVKISNQENDNKTMIYTTLYYLMNPIVVPFLDYTTEYKLHINLDTILKDIEKYRQAIKNKVIRIC